MVVCSAYYLKKCVECMQDHFDDKGNYNAILHFGKLLGIKSCGRKKIDRVIAEYLIDLYCRPDGAFMFLNPESINYSLNLDNYKEKLNVVG